MPPDRAGVLVIGCGAIARELIEIKRRSHLDHLTIECLPARLHNEPELIPDAVEARVRRAAGSYEKIYVAYGDCGTGGRLDSVLVRYGIDRLPGAHCYQFFMGGSAFMDEHETHPGTLYLTDYLVRNFDRLIWSGLGLDRYPHLLGQYFGHYERVLYLSQVLQPELVVLARHQATRLGLGFEHRHVGYGEVVSALLDLGRVSVGAG